MARPVEDAFGKIALIDHREFHPRDLALMKRKSFLPSADSIRSKSYGAEHKYGCLMAVLPEDVRKQITDWSLENIPDCHLDPEEGREDRPHLTIKYGFKDAGIVGELRSLLSRVGPLSFDLLDMSLFPPDKNGCVLKIDVDGQRLHELNRLVSESFDCEDKFPVYLPHVTVAYLRPEVADSYLGVSAPFCHKSVEVGELEYKDAEGERESVYLSFLNGNLSKALSAYVEGSGGALVPPPGIRKRQSLVFDPDGVKKRKSRKKMVPKIPSVKKKSLPYFAKDAGTCGRGERSDLTGCTPASGEAGPQPSGGARQPPESHVKARNVVFRGIAKCKAAIGSLKAKIAKGLNDMGASGEVKTSRFNPLPLLGAVKRGIQKGLEKLNAGIEKRYGKKAAKAIMMAMPAGGALNTVGYVLLALGKNAIGVPGLNDVVAQVGSLAVAESCYWIGKGVKKVMGKAMEEEDVGMSDEDFRKAVAEAQKELVEMVKNETAKHLPELAKLKQGPKLPKPPSVKSLRIKSLLDESAAYSRGYKEGLHDAKRGESNEKNPFVPGTQSNHDYHVGYENAQDKYGSRLIRKRDRLIRKRDK